MKPHYDSWYKLARWKRRRLSIEAAKIGKSLNALIAERLTPANAHK